VLAERGPTVVFVLIAIVMLCAAFMVERWGGAMTEYRPDPKSARAADTRWIDSFYEPFFASKGFAVFLLFPTARVAYFRPLVAIGSSLANKADQNARHGVPVGWNDVATGLREQATELIQVYAQLPRLRAHCEADNPYVLRCDSSAAVFSLDGESLSGGDLWAQVLGPDGGDSNPVLGIAEARDPDLTSGAQLEEGTTREQQRALRELVSANHGAPLRRVVIPMQGLLAEPAAPAIR